MKRALGALPLMLAGAAIAVELDQPLVEQLGEQHARWVEAAPIVIVPTLPELDSEAERWRGSLRPCLPELRGQRLGPLTPPSPRPLRLAVAVAPEPGQKLVVKPLLPQRPDPKARPPALPAGLRVTIERSRGAGIGPIAATSTRGPPLEVGLPDTPAGSLTVAPPAARLPNTPAVAPPAGGLAVEPAPTLLAARLAAGERGAELDRALAQAGESELLGLLARCSRRAGDEPVADELVGELLARGVLAVERAGELKRELALHLGAYLARRADPRCVGLYEGLLAKLGPPAEGGVPELEGLALYWRRAGQPARAAETLLRANRYTTRGELLANLGVEAARDYLQAKDEAAAERVYASVAGYGYGWATGLAIYDRAQRLLQAERYDEARAVLAEEVSGTYAEQIEIALEYLRGRVALGAGELTDAKQRFQRVVDQYAALSRVLPGEGLEAVPASAAEGLRALSRGEREPLWCAPAELIVQVDRRTRRAKGFVAVRSLVPRPLRVAADAGPVSLHVEPAWRRQGLCLERIVRAELALDSVPEDGLVRVSIAADDATGYVVLLSVRWRNGDCQECD